MHKCQTRHETSVSNFEKTNNVDKMNNKFKRCSKTNKRGQTENEKGRNSINANQ